MAISQFGWYYKCGHFYLVQAYLMKLLETMVFLFPRGDAREGGVNAIKIRQTWLMESCNLCHLRLKLLKQEDPIHMKVLVVRLVLYTARNLAHLSGLYLRDVVFT